MTLSQQIFRLNDLLPLIQEDLRGLKERRRLTGLKPSPTETEELIKKGASGWKRERRGESVENTLLRSRSSKHLKKMLRNEIALGRYTALFVVDQRGVLVASINHLPGFFHGNAPWWKRALDPMSTSVLISDVYLSDEGYVLDVVLPIVDDKTVETIGVLKAVIDLQKLLEEPIHQIRFGQTGHAMLIDSAGTVLFCPILPTGSHVSDLPLVTSVSSLESGWIRAKDDGHGGKNSIVGFSPVTKINKIITGGGSDKRWHTFIRQEPSETYEPIRLLQRVTTIAGLVLIALLTGIATFMANRLARPIDLIRDGARRIGSGELSHRLPSPSRDEIGELAHEFNKMADQLYESTALLEQKVIDRTEDLALINQVSLVANRSLDLQTILKETLSLLVERMDADAGHIGVYNEAETDNVKKTGFSTEEWLGAPDDVRQSWEQQQKSGLLEAPMIIDSKKPPPVDTPLPFLHSLYTHVNSVPIKGGNGVFGTLSLANTRSIPFPPNIADLLVAVSRPIGMAVQNAQLYEKTKQIDRLKTELISNVSHEIRTPLTSILGFTELLESNITDQKARKEAFTVINRERMHLTNHLNDLLDFSKLTSALARRTMAPIDNQKLLLSSINFAKPLADKKGLLLRMAPLTAIDPIHGDEGRLRQVMNNLLSNAVKFTASGEITVGAKQEGSLAILFVRDTGPGIKPGDREKIFDKFYQINKKSLGKPSGTGHGLPICREIISHHGGEIWCESTPGMGSTFYFTLLPSSDA